MNRITASLESELRQSQPLVLYGMHRSGTSLMVRLLGDLGFHMGSWLSRDAESVHFQRLNRRIYSATGSTWGEVDSLVERMGSAEFVAEQAALTRRRLFQARPWLGQKPVIADFFGQALWEQVTRGDSLAWGFKDPRTTLTLPVWREILPRARYVHMLRNGIDVAISIHRRSLKQQRKWRNHLLRFDYVPATLDFGYSFRLWETYVAFALRQKPLIPAEQAYEIRYEDLLAEPKAQLQGLLAFLEHPVSDSQLSAACQQIDRSRRDNAGYAANYRPWIPSLAASPLMQQLGYAYPSGIQGEGIGERPARP